MPNHEHHHGHEHQVQGAAELTRTVVDPVCGMIVDPETTKHRLKLGDATYHFCSARCLEKFKAEPDRYLNPPDKDPAVTSPACALAGTSTSI